MNKPSSIRKTPLYALHVELGAKMVPFAGYDMPIQYPGGIIKEHQHTRTHAGLFDVSHMGQILLSGPNITRELERLLPVDLEALDTDQQSYAVLTTSSGGILDDLIVTRFSEDVFFLVVNAACKQQDIEHLRNNLGADIQIETLTDRALIALQAPNAYKVMAKLAPATNDLVFMHGCRTVISGVECYVTRSGYTGEDGFEISLPAAQSESVARLILSFDEIEPIGLGARDSLRLEAGLCLYGHDMDCTTSPIEAALLWSISKSRRPDGSKAGGFIGAEEIFSQIRNGASRKRVGLAVAGRVPVREGARLVNSAGEEIGSVTSGGFGATLNAPVALGYVGSEFSKVGTQLFALVRDKKIPVTVAKTPSVPQRYYRG